MRENAERLAEWCCEKNWINAEDRMWCVYVLEKWMGILLFFSSVTVWMAVSGLWGETLGFLIPFYLLRRRIGGCHAKSARACYLISMGLVILISAFLGRWLLLLPRELILLLDGAAVLAGLLLSPAYPPQVNFTEEEKAANGRKKNLLLGEFFLLQLVTTVIPGFRFPAFSFCGISVSLITVIIQKKILKRGFER